MEIEITSIQNAIIREMIISGCAAYKNWIATAVEAEQFIRASELVTDLRIRQDMLHIFKREE